MMVISTNFQNSNPGCALCPHTAPVATSRTGLGSYQHLPPFQDVTLNFAVLHSWGMVCQDVNHHEL